MKKKVCSLLLAAIFLLGAFSAAFPVYASSALKASEECISLLKEMEGFVQYPVEDYNQISVGYGSRVPEEDLERYTKDGITKEEAEILLREYVTAFEGVLNNFADKNNRSFSQNEFDALILFTYNCGSGWTSGTELSNVVKKELKGNDFLCAIVSWCSAGGKVQTGLIHRRLCEAAIYLENVYSTTRPEQYCYVMYNAKGGKCGTSVQAFYRNDLLEKLPVPEKSGYDFCGWKTASGEFVYAMNPSLDGKVLFAEWAEAGAGEQKTADAPTGSECDEQYKIKAEYGVPVYEKPLTSSAQVGSLALGKIVDICEKGTDSSKKEWGKIKDTGWIELTNAELIPKADPTPAEEAIASVKVTASNLNVRKEPGGDVTDCIHKGDVVSIVEIKEVNGELWGRISGKGWINLSYTDYSGKGKETPETPDKPAEAVAKGTVQCTNLNIRTEPVKGTVLKTYPKGTSVTIYEIKTVDNVKWGKTADGWICLTYVKLTESSSSAEPEKPTEPEKPDPEKPTDPEKKDTLTGTVTASALNVRSAPVNGTVMTTVHKGDKLTILETKTVDGAKWGRISGGWVCMTYVKLADSSASTEPEKPDPEKPADPEKKDTVTATVIASALNVRSAPVNGTVMTTVHMGDRITILETKTVDNVKWGKIEGGWICMTYVKVDTEEGGSSTGTDGKPVTGIVTATSLCIRSGPGTNYGVLNGYSKGTKVTITEQRTVGSVVWGKVEGGWICMTFVKLS